MLIHNNFIHEFPSLIGFIRLKAWSRVVLIKEHQVNIASKLKTSTVCGKASNHIAARQGTHVHIAKIAGGGRFE